MATNSISPLPLRTLRRFAGHPTYFLLLQLPAVPLFVSGELVPLGNPDQLWQWFLLLGVYFPFVVGSLAAATAATWLGLASLEAEPSPLSWKEAVAKSLKALPSLLPASIISASLVLVSLLVIPLGVYFSAIFLFVPHVALADPGRSATIYLTRSKRIAKRHLWRSLLVALALLTFDIIGFVILELVSQQIPGGAGGPRAAAAFLLKGFLSVTISATINIAVGEHYRTCSRTGEHETNRGSTGEGAGGGPVVG